MSRAVDTAPLPHVMLPWAQSTWHGGNPIVERGGSLPVAAAERGRDALLLGRDDKASAHAPSRRRGGPLAAGGHAARPIFRPLPEVPIDDRGDYAPASLVSLAVALDVLSTLTRRMPTDALILDGLAAILLHVSALGGASADAASKLVGYARTAAASERARLSQALAGQAQESGITTVAAESVPGASSPASVAAATHRLEAAAAILVRDARLLLAAQEGIDYRQV